MTPFITTERDALSFVIGIMAALVEDESKDRGLRAIAIEAYDVLAVRLRELGVDLSVVDEKFEAARAGFLADVDDGDSGDVPSGDNG